MQIIERTHMSDCIFNQVAQHPKVIEAKRIMLYWAMPEEVQTQDFIRTWWKKKEIYLPTIINNRIWPALFCGEETLIFPPPFFIGTPKEGKLAEDNELDVIIVPGVAFYENNRLGRGKGYYDKFLTTSKAYKIGVCFPQQLILFPTEPHDIQMNEVISI